MRLDLDVTGRRVSVFGTPVGSRRVRRAGALTAVPDSSELVREALAHLEWLISTDWSVR